MELNVLVRGQSNAVLFTSFGGVWDLQAEVQRLLGFDGTTNKINIIADYNSPTDKNTAVGGTSFLKDWMTQNADGSWSADQHENNLLANLRAQPASVRAAETATVWIHNEYDSQEGGFTSQDWMNAVKADAAMVRGVLGQTAATTPYLFVDVPYNNARADANQAIKIGMERLAADDGFNAGIGAQLNDADMNGYDNYGGSHIGTADTTMLAHRLAVSLANTFASHALPGSPLALAGGQIDDLGPQVVQAQSVAGNANQALLSISFDEASSLKSLDATAVGGGGWYAGTLEGGQYATGAELVDASHIRVTFANAIGSGDSIFYGFGAGRVSAADGSGDGIYDNNGMPIWTSASGVQMNAAASVIDNTPSIPAPFIPAPPVLAPVIASPVTGNGSDTIVVRLSQDAYQGDAQYIISVDGKQMLTGSVGASHGAGQGQDVTVTGNFGAGQHTLAVNFLNDAWGGTSGTDRNLYVEKVTFNGVDNNISDSLWSSGSKDYQVSGVAPHTATSQTIGSGLESIVLHLSQDAYQGDAQFTVSVDGKQVGGTMSASALHGAGATDTVTVLGNYGAGQHVVNVNFLNDAWGGSSDTDRNLYVDSVTYKGADARLTGELFSTGGQDFKVGGAAAISAPVVASAPVTTPAPVSTDPYAAFTHDGVVDWAAAAAAVTAHYEATGYWGL